MIDTAGIGVKDVSFSYGDYPVLKGVTFFVRPGEICCILGPNGCGKTTLLRCLNGLLSPHHGDVFVDRSKLSEMNRSVVARNVSFVFQNEQPTLPFTTLEMVLMGRAPHIGFFRPPSATDIQLAEEALESVGMLSFRNRVCTRLSGGQRQLVLIARALAQDASVMLLDEPTAHLDFANEMQVLTILRSLVEKRRLSIVMATHFPNHPLLLDGRAILLKEGRILADGPASDVITEKSIHQLYGVKARIVSIPGNGHDARASAVVVPLVQSEQPEE